MNQSDHDFSSEESTVDDVDKDADFILASSSTLSDTRDDEDESNHQREENVVVDFIDFTEWGDVSLDPLPKLKTNSEVWCYFGILKKGGKIFKPMSTRKFCRPCFDTHTFKR